MLLKYDHIIPLGAHCVPPYLLKKLGLRRASNPFDWIFRDEADTFQLEEIISLIKNRFSCFFDKKYLEIRNDLEGVNTAVIRNTKTKFIFMHELKKDQSLEEYYDSIKEKYDRRIARFYHNIQTSSAVLFIYMEGDIKPDTPELVLVSFIEEMKIIFPSTRIDLLFFQHDADLGEFETSEIFRDHIIKVKLNNNKKYAPCPELYWRRNEKVYQEIFLKYCLLRRTQESAHRIPKVTVLLLVKNSDKYLRLAINSILNQTVQDWELFVMESKCDTRIENIIAEYEDSRIRLFHCDSVELRTAFNKAVQQAKGNYIALMSGEEYSFPERLTKQVDFLEKNRQISIVGTYQEYFGKSHWIYALNSYLETTVILNCNFGCCNLMLRKQDISNKFYLSYLQKVINSEKTSCLSFTGRFNFSIIPERLGTHCVLSENNKLSADNKQNLYEYDTLGNTLTEDFFGEINGAGYVPMRGIGKLLGKFKHLLSRIRYQRQLTNLFKYIEENNKNSIVMQKTGLQDFLRIFYKTITAEIAYMRDPDRNYTYRTTNLLNFPLVAMSKKGTTIRYYLCGLPVYKKHMKK